MATNSDAPSGSTRRAYLRGIAAASLGFAGCGRSTDAAIEAPAAARVDESPPIVATGLSMDRAVLQLRTTAPYRTTTLTWTSDTTFDVIDGQVDPGEQPPIAGPYDGTHPMGPVWTMMPEVSPQNALFPLETHELNVSVREPGADASIVSTTMRRRLPEPESQPLPGDLVGSLYLPDVDGSAPGVVVLHGSGREPLNRRARLLAGHGFVVAALDYIGEDSALPDYLVEVPVEYVQRAIDAVAGHQRVSGSQVGVYGVSKGAELALLVGSLAENVGAVVSVVGSGMVWAGGRLRSVADTSSWSVDGEPVPYVPIPADQYDRTGSRSTFAAGFEAASRAEIDAATIPVKRIDGPVLLVSAGDDGLWNSVRYSEIAAKRLRDHDHPHAVEHLVYEEAGHFIRPPFLPTYGLSQVGATRMGGTPAGNARAASDHWPTVISILSKAVDA